MDKSLPDRQLQEMYIATMKRITDLERDLAYARKQIEDTQRQMATYQLNTGMREKELLATIKTLGGNVPEEEL